MLTTDDGVRLHYEETGSGTPIIFVHEFAGDARSWEPQLRHFSRRYRCVAYNARGYPPSDVPDSHRALFAGARRATISARARCPEDRGRPTSRPVDGRARHAALRAHLSAARPLLTFAGGGYGSAPASGKKFQDDSRANAQPIREKGMHAFRRHYCSGPARVQLQKKDPSRLRSST
jgi:pimeloyl-ACP methyl ester carboxylesterase